VGRSGQERDSWERAGAREDRVVSTAGAEQSRAGRQDSRTAGQARYGWFAWADGRLRGRRAGGRSRTRPGAVALRACWGLQARTGSAIGGGAVVVVVESRSS
jgi:hypothetical protein